jgi:tetratricopeptide (TPR) repeat protein
MDSRFVSRRAFLRKLRWAPALLSPARLRVCPFDFALPHWTQRQISDIALSDSRFVPHYPSSSPLEDLFKLVPPGLDAYPTEKYATEIANQLNRWSAALNASPPALDSLSRFLRASVEFNSTDAAEVTTIPADSTIHLRKNKYGGSSRAGRDLFLVQMKEHLAPLARIQVSEFLISDLQVTSQHPLSVVTEIRHTFVGSHRDGSREERIGFWKLVWSLDSGGVWIVEKWNFVEETIALVSSPLFRDVSVQSLQQIASYRDQMLLGVDHWRTILDGASGIDVYGNNGIAAGDFDNDGFDDLYICQPSGLPNRLYRNRGDGTFEDVTEKSGVGVLDATACAIFADFENKGLQDLLVVCASGPLLFINQGNGKFQCKREAFAFAKPPQGTFTHAAVADYDRDGRLDIYFCVYSYYLGLDQYHYPSPYFDARNGPPNFLFHNEGNASFADHTHAAGLNVENDRFSFASAWGDINSNGWPDLYVANDFGRSNLYRNRGNGSFETVSEHAGVDGPGAGMSACWFDCDNDGKQDIYVSNMWSAAGQRVSGQNVFHANESAGVRALYRGHARGNSLYKNSGDGRFHNASVPAGVEMGRWAWSSDSWDFNHDGYSDLYIANGYVSSADRNDLGSFFWRQVVGNSPPTSAASPLYERGWNAINELIRSDSTWNGYERNTFYLNNRNGTFSEISGIAGLDFLDDSRSFALADLDHDGRLELILKNRNAPQLRILHNVMSEMGNAVSFRLQGTISNRDAIGARVTVSCGQLRQVKSLQAGSGFLSQHSKELFFGLSKIDSPVAATIEWPSGRTQTFERLPLNHRISVQEGNSDISLTKFGSAALAYSEQVAIPPLERLPENSETWLLDPLPAPDFVLPDLSGKTHSLRSHLGRPLLLHFWLQASPACAEQLKLFEEQKTAWSSKGLQILSINVDPVENVTGVQALAKQRGISLPILLASPDVAGIYNILYRYLFDRRRDLPLPSSFLLDESGMIVKIYQGTVKPLQFLQDVASIPGNEAERIHKALPFPGNLYMGSFQRNDFTYGVALFQRGYLDQAATSFKQVVAAKPNDPDAYYNLGTLYLRKNELKEARRFLEQTVELRQDYPEAWNNLGMIAAEENQPDEAVRNFRKSLSLRPEYTTALLNLGNIYRRQGNLSDARQLLSRALALEPENPEANYSLGMLYARQNDPGHAVELLQNAIRIRPGYADAWNNLGVLLVRQGRNSDAEEKFKVCIQVAPNFDQAYLNLAQLYMLSKERAKAREVLQSLLRLQPQHKIAQQTLEMLN